ncbi:hypothetical protein K435DRAFT_690979, partial [Dendrothele bispora CBS 962.96]
RDVLGLVRTIVVKVRSSSKRKQAFLDIQLRNGGTKALQLLLDMVVRWSSTYKMIHRAESLKEHINTFIYELALEERDLDKRRKMDALRLTPEEWNQVDVLIDILTHADKAQQAFSSENEPTLHNAIPALEKLHSAWSVRMNRPKYTQFSDALNAGINKLATYYNKTSDSDAYVFSMCMWSV